ncbi:general secretion pathway protein GspK [Allofranklinella schreckenbergeri]|nr:general secretion pathway protein GspK [Allofranklinella schreckenbergeri]
MIAMPTAPFVIAPPAAASAAPRPQRGVALLLAMLIVALVASLAASASWQQWRSAQAEADERAQAQVHWLVRGALDWSKIILRIDATDDRRKAQQADHLDEPWTVPLAESKLGAFLSAERNIATDANADLGQAYFSGGMLDLDGRLNLSNLIRHQAIDPAALAQWQRLFEALGLGGDLAQQVAQKYLDATRRDLDAPVPLAPRCIEQLGWLGLSAEHIALLRPHATILPGRTRLNLNTASARVLAAALPPQAGAATAEKLAAVRMKPFTSLADAQAFMPEGVQLDANLFGVASQYFLVAGRLRIDELEIQDQFLVERQGQTLQTLGRACPVPPGTPLEALMQASP